MRYRFEEMRAMNEETTTDRLAEIEGQAEPQPVQVREGRWRTRGGDIRNIIPTPAQHSESGRCSWHDAHYYETWYPSGRYFLNGEHPLDLVEYLGPSEAEPEQTITPDDVAAEALAGAWDQAQAEQQIRTMQAIMSGQAETIARLNSEVHGLSIQNAELLAQREAVKDELVQERLERNQWQNHAQRTETQLVEKVSECRNLRIELDALQQAPQAEPVAAVPTSKDDRFEEGWDAGTARAVETIAEWLEPIKAAMDAADNQDELARAGFFAIDTIRHLPVIMRSLTGLTEED